ncbi:hypothetical protein [uncultured Selenomonas sp.]|uniref:hypothetical protein n=1 Tax=uncultured Selenomonas sp. TaxID=159275 RepID=UPI002805B052|nr:hypothetical protein [uncultured Selenomonas sp.]
MLHPNFRVTQVAVIGRGILAHHCVIVCGDTLCRRQSEAGTAPPCPYGGGIWEQWLRKEVAVPRILLTS